MPKHKHPAHTILTACLAAVGCLSVFIASAAADALPYGHDYFSVRDGLTNSRVRFEGEKRGRVAFLGGSITAMKGWRELTCEALERRFAGTEFDFVDAGIPSVDSTGDAFRFSQDVLRRGAVDLMFVDASVNDFHNKRTRAERIRAMEGIVRHARRANPKMDIVFLCFVDPGYLPIYDAGKTPEVIVDHLKVAEYYGVASIELAREVAERIRAGQFAWGKFRDCHPSPFGHGLYVNAIDRLFDAAWAGPLDDTVVVKDHKLPPRPLDAACYEGGRLVDVSEAKIAKGWRLEESWKPKGGGGTRAGFVNVPMLVADEAGAELVLKFNGTAVGAFVTAGPDCGVLEYSIDGGPLQQVDQFTEWSGGLYLPWALLFTADLEPGDHVLKLRTSDRNNPQSKGHACQIRWFMVSGE